MPPLPSTLALDEQGFAVVPAGLLATIETSLERKTPAQPNQHPLPAGYQLVQPEPVDVHAFKTLFHAIGDPWLWYGRLTKSDEAIRSILTAPTLTLRFLLAPDHTPVGLFEAQRQDTSLEVTYFGLTPDQTGKGLGAAMLEHGLEAAWQEGITRAWLHTCTFDSPAALSFYQKQGFAPFKHRVELAEDPRLLGLLPRNAAPHIPLADFSEP